MKQSMQILQVSFIKINKSVIVLFAFFITMVSLQAQVTWTGTTDTDWNTGTNWDGGSVPSATDDVLIPDTPNDPVIMAGTNAVAQSVEIQRDATLELLSGASLTIANASNQGMVVREDAQLTNDGTINIDHTIGDGIFIDDSAQALLNTSNGQILIGQNGGNIGQDGINCSDDSDGINNNGGTIVIDHTGRDGIFCDANFRNNNSGQVLIGQNGGQIGRHGIFSDYGNFNNNNGSTVSVDETNSAAIKIESEENFNNKNGSQILIGQSTGNVIGRGLNLVVDNFTNDDAIIKIDNTNSTGIILTQGIHINKNGGEIQIGQGSGNVGGTGLIVNEIVSFNNENGKILVDQVNGDAIKMELESTFTNQADGEIIIGSIGSVGGNGVRVDEEDQFNNEGMIRIDNTSSNGIRIKDGGLFTNLATLEIGQIGAIGSSGITLNEGGQFENEGTINIDNTTLAGIDNNGVFTNHHILQIGSTGGAENIQANGIKNENSFTNEGGEITIDGTKENAILNQTGTFTNKASISIGATTAIKNHRIANQAAFENDLNSSLQVDNVLEAGISIGVSGVYNNAGAIVIGLNQKVEFGILASGIFNNNIGGSIQIEETEVGGISIGTGGTFNNHASIILGLNKNVGISGIYNNKNFINSANGTIQIEECERWGLINFASFVNEGTITVGTVKKTGIWGIYNQADFDNNVGGNIQIEDAGNEGIANSSNPDPLFNTVGLFNNYGAISIGANKPLNGNGVANNAIFNNHTGSTLLIDNTFVGIRNGGLEPSAEFSNDGLISIGAVHGIGVTGIINDATFDNTAGEINVSNTQDKALLNNASVHNHSCAIIRLLDDLDNSNGLADFINDGLLSIDAAENSLPGNFTNNGVIEDIQGTFLGTFNNNEIIVAPTIIECGDGGQAFQLGSPIDFTIHGIFSDQAAITLAGNYDLVTNIFSPTTPLAEGIYDYFVKIEDLIGGCTRIVSWQLTIDDTTPPQPKCKDSVVGLGPDGTSSITESLVFNGGTDNCGAVLFQEMDITEVDCDDVLETIDITVTAHDGNGNVNTCIASVLVKETIPPNPICKHPTVYLNEFGIHFLSNNQVFDSGTDNCGSVSVVDLSRFLVSCNNAGSTVQVIVRTVDDNGNFASCTSKVTVVDDILPQPNCLHPTIELPAGGNYTLSETEIYDGATDNCGTVSLIGFSPQTVDCEQSGGSVAVTVTVEDSNGNQNTCTANVTIEDNEAPTVFCKDPLVFLDASGNYILQSSDVFDGGSDNCSPVTFVEMSLTSLDCSDVGNTVTVTVTGQDASGNQNTCTANVSVEDNTPPLPTCLNPTVQLNANGNHDLSTTEVFGGGTDNCSAVSFVSMSLGSVGCSDVGTPVSVTVTAQDADGNQATCTATVSVIDDITPVASCQDLTIELDADGNASISAVQVDNGSFDNCEIASKTLDINTFACANVGTNTVMLTVTDMSSNISECSATITVEDNLTPVAQCTTVIYASLDNNGEYTINPDDLNDGSSDACGIQSLSASPSFLDCSNEGINNVTLTVFDENGNSSTCFTAIEVASFFSIDNVIENDETCAGMSNGSITVQTTTGGGQVGYSIDGGANFQFNNTFNSLPPGTYNIVVKLFGINAMCEKTAIAVVGAGGQPQQWFQDMDGDRYSDGTTMNSCNQPAGYYLAADLLSTNGDCNDNEPAVNPGAPESCDGLDNNCDGQLLPDEIDADGDGYLICDGDCDDTDPNVHPGAVEICNGIDDDCDGEIDEGTTGGLTWTGNIAFYTQADVDAFSQCYSIIDGSVIIQGADITDLSNLSNLEEITGNFTIQMTGLISLTGLDNLAEVGGFLTIYYNSLLVTLDGLDALGTVSGNLSAYYNFVLADGCAIHNLINGGVGGTTSIFLNATGCNSVAEINANCGANSLISNPSSTQNQQVTGNAIQSDAKEKSVRCKVFPNPAAHTATIRLEETVHSATVLLTDPTGRILMKINTTTVTDQIRLDLANLKAGTYFLQIITDGRKPFAQRLMVID
ncbi:MAG: MopE-related protein [Bacteroidota bacterium]